MDNARGAAVRVPDFAGALNFRDMGGYATVDGRSVRWNRLYRSGTTHALTPEDLQRVAAMGIRHVHDLRSDSERANHPNRLSGLANVDTWFRSHERIPGDFRRLLLRTDARPERSRELMIAVYRDLPYDFRDAYRELFLSLADGHTPLVFNCSAGKDRTGVAAALLLTALGVPRDIILEDYLLSERFYEPCCRMMLRGKDEALFRGIPPEIWEPVMHTDAAYLGAMFERLESAHGSTMHYLSEELGVDAVVIDGLRAHLLEKP